MMFSVSWMKEGNGGFGDGGGDGGGGDGDGGDVYCDLVEER